MEHSPVDPILLQSVLRGHGGVNDTIFVEIYIREKGSSGGDGLDNKQMSIWYIQNK